MAKIKLYMTPGSCSTGIHILLKELDLAFDASIVNLPAGSQYKSKYIATNPKSAMPVLVTTNGITITEFPAIAWWLARNYPDAGLLPKDSDVEINVLESISYIVGTLHMQGFGRIFTPENYALDHADREEIKVQGEKIAKKGFAILNQQLQGNFYLGENFSIVDAALFYVEFWAEYSDIELPKNCHRHYLNMLSRPAVKRVLMEEGFASAITQQAPTNISHPCATKLLG